MHKVALFAIVFASLAPSISHALASQQSVNSFAQEICNSDGRKITIQVETSKGQQLTTNLGIEGAGSQWPASILLHLNHCPFCANPNIDTVIESPPALIIALLTAQTEQLVVSTLAVLSSFSVLPPPAQAPPSTLIKQNA